MKKFFMMLIAAAAIAMVGCQKDDDSKDGLSGTKWSYSIGERFDSFTMTLSFSSGGTVSVNVVEIYDGERYSATSKATYTYNHPTVRIVFKDEDGKGGSIWTGIISGDMMTVYDEDDDVFGVFTKK